MGCDARNKKCGAKLSTMNLWSWLSRIVYATIPVYGHACEGIADILEGKEYAPWEPK